MPETTALAIDLIKLDGGTQPRAEIDEDTVTDYTAVWESNGKEYPFDKPCEVFHDGSTYWCVDGFHRILAGHRAKRGSVPCVVHKGTVRDAKLYAFKCNDRHGLRRSNADKRFGVSELLKDSEWGKSSSRWIADATGVSHTFVDAVRLELKPKAQVATVATCTNGGVIKQVKRTGKDGKTYPVKNCQVSSDGEHEWDSDGSGERFCIHCKEDHPDSKKPRAKQGKEISPAKMVDELTKKHVGYLVRGIDAVAKINGGKGPNHKQANDSLNTLIKALKGMRKGER